MVGGEFATSVDAVGVELSVELGFGLCALLGACDLACVFMGLRAWDFPTERALPRPPLKLYILEPSKLAKN